MPPAQRRGTKVLERKAGEWSRGAAKVEDFVTEAGMRKFRWAGKISAIKNDERVKRITE